MWLKLTSPTNFARPRESSYPVDTHVNVPVPHVVHAYGARIVVRLAGHVLGHHGTHPVDQALGGILTLDAADRHVGSGGGGGSGGHGSGR